MIRALAVVLVAAAFAVPAEAAEVAEPAQPAPPFAAPDSADSAGAEIDAYLRDLESRTDESFDVDVFSLPAAEVDSLIRVWQASRDSSAEPAASPRRQRWSARVEAAAVRYNRVEGVNVMPEVIVTAPTRRRLALLSGVGYGWAAEEPTWHVGLESEIPWPRAGTLLSASHRRDVWAYGAGGVPGNSVLAITSGKDYADYFRGEGWSASIDVPVGALRAGASWQDELQESLANEARFTLFEGQQDFRPNPPIDDGRLHAVELGLSWGDAAEGTHAGDVHVARAGSGLGGDFDFDRVRAELVGRRQLWFGDELKARGTAGSVRGGAPLQALHHVGGTKLLRGYEINEFPTRRFAHLALDYTIATDPLGSIPFLRHLRLQPVPFFDAAAVLETRTRSDTFWRFSTGVGIQRNLLGIPGGKGQLRVELARRLDRGEDATTARVGFTMER